MSESQVILSEAQLRGGWHFCGEHEFTLLVGPEMEEWGGEEKCRCGFHGGCLDEVMDD